MKRINGTKNQTGARRQNVGIGMMLTSYILIVGILFSGLPSKATAQDQSLVPDFNLSNERMQMGTKVTDKRSKMSIGSFSELQAMAKEKDAKNTAPQTATSADDSEYYVLNVEFKTIAARRALFSDLRKSTLTGAHVLTATDKFADVFVEGEAPWDALLMNPNVLRVEYDTEVSVPPPPDAVPLPGGKQSVPEQIVRNGHMNLNGKGVTIAIVDTGIDFRHPDFIKYDAQGRLPHASNSFGTRRRHFSLVAV